MWPYPWRCNKCYTTAYTFKFYFLEITVIKNILPAWDNSLKKLNKIALNTKTIYLEDDNHKDFKFNGGKLTFTLQLFKI